MNERRKAPLWDYDELRSRILYEDAELLVVNKPYDWPTSGDDLDDDDCVQYHLIHHFGQMIWAVHQLDADTSGVCLFAKTKQATSRYHQDLSHSATIKEYTAIVNGVPTWDRHVETATLGKVDARNHGIVPLESGGKEACSHFEVLEKKSDYTIVKVLIKTGRTHQIRIHLAHLGHPLIGEDWYIEPSTCYRHFRQALHASRVQFMSGQEFHAPLADDLKPLL